MYAGVYIDVNRSWSTTFIQFPFATFEMYTKMKTKYEKRFDCMHYASMATSSWDRVKVEH